MIATDLVRAVLVAAAAACLFVGAPDVTIYVLATLAAVAGAPFRPAQMAIMPSLATDADELTASNGAASTIESLAFFVGPAIGALLLSVSEVAEVFALNAVTFLVSALLVLGVRPFSEPTAPAADDHEVTRKPSFVAETLAGFRAIAADRDPAMVAVLLCAQTLVSGASLVFVLVMAVEILGLEPQGGSSRPSWVSEP